jgi:sugar lactone lactonase YvrE
VDAPGTISTVAGNGTQGFGGDGGPATDANLDGPVGIALDSAGNLFIADTFNNRIRRVDASGTITTVAGDGAAGLAGDFGGDGGPATSAKLYWPLDVAVDSDGNIFIADRHNHRVRRVDATTRIITTVAGNGTAGFGGDGGPATGANLRGPNGVALDSDGNLFIADLGNQRIRRVDADTGNITTVAGDGTRDFGGDGGPATSAKLYGPRSVALDGNGNLFIADTGNRRIRRVDASTGIITTVAGNGTQGFGGDGGPATSANLDGPISVMLDSNGNLIIADNNRIRRVDITPTDTDVYF